MYTNLSEYPVSVGDAITILSHCSDFLPHNPTINELRVVNINFQSIMNKRVDLQEFIYRYKPDIIVGTETWLSANISDNEIVPAELNYNIYRKDRADDYGGVMIAVSNVIPS